MKTIETDGYEAVQLAFEAVAERKISKPELGHLQEGGRRRRTGTSSSSAAASELDGRRDGHRRGVRARRRDQGRGHRRSARASPGTIKRHNFNRGPKSHGSHNIRKPGSIGASATPSRVFKGMRMAGRMGGKRVTQVGLASTTSTPEQNLLLVKGAVPGPKNGIVEIREEKAHTATTAT